ncbi:MAG: hypothetical protein R3B06_04150 [Kofleriaceae bacterium]
MSSRAPAPPPPDPGAVCGNGVIEALPGTCEQQCAGGCDQPVTCAIVCTQPREQCERGQVAETCVGLGFAAGTVGCTDGCELDAQSCVACVPGPDTRCGAIRLAGDEPLAVAAGGKAAVFVFDNATGRLAGVRVDAALRAKPLKGLPTGLVAVGELDGGVGFVDKRDRFGVVDPAGRVKLRGVAGAATGPVLILRETAGAGAAVLAGGYQTLTLATFDPPGGARPAAVRHFYLGNRRVVVVPGAHELARGVTTGGADLVVIADGAGAQAYQRDGHALTRLPTVPAGVTLAFADAAYTDRVRWSTGELATTRLTYTAPDAPVPPGLSRAMLGGASVVSAFGGLLIAAVPRTDRRLTELAWVPGADPLVPVVPAAAP